MSIALCLFGCECRLLLGIASVWARVWHRSREAGHVRQHGCEQNKMCLVSLRHRNDTRLCVCVCVRERAASTLTWNCSSLHAVSHLFSPSFHLSMPFSSFFATLQFFHLLPHCVSCSVVIKWRGRHYSPGYTRAQTVAWLQQDESELCLVYPGVILTKTCGPVPHTQWYWL